MSPTGRYAIIYWKNLNKDRVSVKVFDDEQEMVNFAESRREQRYVILVGEMVALKYGEKVYKVRNYGAYPYFKWLYKLIGLFLIGVIIFLILSWK